MKKIIFFYLIFTFALQADEFERDLEFIHQTTGQDHPGMHNPLDPSFAEKLEENYLRAKEELKCGEEKTQALKKFGQSFQDSHLFVKYDAPARTAGEVVYRIEALNDEIYWVSIPSFYPATEEQKKDFHQIVATLPTLREKTIVFDVRGNRGGSFFNGTALIESLFGKRYAEQRLFDLYRHCYTMWRVSSDNLRHLKEIILPYIRENQSSFAPWYETLAGNLEAAWEQKIPTFFQPLDFKGAPSFPLEHNRVNKTIYVIADRNCYSATLMFIDELKGMGGKVALVGETTGADSMYMELKILPLPSGKGTVGLPIYVYAGPFRGHNIPHYPDIQYAGDLQNTLELQEYIKRIEDK
jgi:Peptidase family S41